MERVMRALSRLFQIRWFAVLVAGACVTALMLELYVAQPRFLRLLDLKVYDSLLHLYGDKNPSPQPVIVDLDDASLAAYGQWPWPRYLLADLLEKLTAYGVLATGVDVLLTEPDRSAPRRTRDDLKRFFALDVDFAGLPDILYDYDQLLAAVLRPLPVVLGMAARFAREPGAPDGPGTPSGPDTPSGPSTPYTPSGPDTPGTPNSPGAPNSPDSPGTPDAPPASGAVGFVIQQAAGAPAFAGLPHQAVALMQPLPILREGTALGLLTMNPDIDGVVRRIPLLAAYQNKYYSSLALRTLMAATGKKSLIGVVGQDGLEAVRLGPYTVPVSPEGSMLVPFRGPRGSYAYISAKDVLDQRVPPEALHGKIAFVGTSAVGLLDIRISPLERVLPGVEVHAAVLDAIVQQKYLHVPFYTPGLQVAVVFLCGVIGAVAFGFASPKIYLPIGGGLAGGVLYAAVRLFQGGVFLSPLYALLTLMLQGVVLLCMRFWQEERQKQVLRSAFARYVAPEIVDRITRLRGNVFAGEERELTIMFTDIRGFTSISEKLRPEQVVQLLNRYFTPMTALVRGNKGTLDKFIGDALMAFWNAPIAVPDHPVLAVRTALAMQEKLVEINPGLLADFGVSIGMGAGLHTGSAYVGNMGSEELLNYTLIGDSVNLASRLESLCSRYGAKVVVSAETAARCAGQCRFVPLDRLRVKGKQLPVDVLEAVTDTAWSERGAEFAAWRGAFEQYLAGDFAAAGAACAALLVAHPHSALYRLYAVRCENLCAAPPATWDGVWTMTEK